MKTAVKHRLVLLFALLTVIPLSACGSDNSGTGPGGQRNAPSSITVLADSSLKAAFDRIGQQFEAQNAGKTVNFTYGQSAKLAQSAAAGGAGDALTTADQADMDSAQKVQLDSPDVFASKGQATYAITTLTQSKNTSLTQQFNNFVTSQAGQQILLQNGFKAP